MVTNWRNCSGGDPARYRRRYSALDRLGDSVSFNKAVMLCEHRQLEAAVNTNLIENFRQVVLDRVFTDPKMASDISIRHGFSDRLNDLGLARRQSISIRPFNGHLRRLDWSTS